MNIRLFLVLLLLATCTESWSAVITSKVVGTAGTPALASVASNWVGDVAPVDGDTIIIVPGAVITQDINRIYGSRASAVGHAVRVNATDASTYGVFRVNAGVTLTLRGYDRGSNQALYAAKDAVFNPLSGSTVLVDGAADYSTVITIDGHMWADGVTFSVPASNITWNTVTTDTVLTDLTNITYDQLANIQIIKLKNGGVMDPGPISNAAGTGIGSFGDSGFTIVSSSTLTTEVSSLAGVNAEGKYYIDYGKGILYYNTSGAGITLTYRYKFGKWNAAGILAQNNVSGSSIRLSNNTFNYFGSVYNQDELTSGGAIMTRYKSATSLDATRAVEIKNNTFNYCTRPITVYNHAADASHLIDLSGNSFINNRFTTGLISVGYNGYLNISGNTFDSFAMLFSGDYVRGPANGIRVKNNTGSLALLGGLGSDLLVQGNVITGFSNVYDSSIQINSGGALGANNVWDRNSFSNCGRAAWLTSYQVVVGNTFSKCFADGLIGNSSGPAYNTNVVIRNNIFKNSITRPAGGINPDTGGGLNFGSNYDEWVNNYDVSNNTFDHGQRGITFALPETSVTLVTNTRIVGNIVSNSKSGIYRYSSGVDVSKLHLLHVDYNDDFANSPSTTNIKQASFLYQGELYNYSRTRAILGVALFNPSATLPQLTGKTLSLVVAGTAGTNLSANLSWGGGAPYNLIKYQGTATGGTGATTHTTPGTLVKTGAGWTTNAYRLMYLKNISTGGLYLIRSNTSDTLTLMPQNTGALPAPIAGNTFIILDSEAQLSDGTNMVHAGIYGPEIPLAAGTYTDPGITITGNGLAVDPQFSASLIPTNSALLGSGYGGADIGAPAYSTDTVGPSIITSLPSRVSTVIPSESATLLCQDSNACQSMQYCLEIACGTPCTPSTPYSSAIKPGMNRPCFGYCATATDVAGNVTTQCFSGNRETEGAPAPDPSSARPCSFAFGPLRFRF